MALTKAEEANFFERNPHFVQPYRSRLIGTSLCQGAALQYLGRGYGVNEFPQFMFLPKKPVLLEVDSLLRLDELQSVFTPHLDPTQHSLGDETLEVLKGQIGFLILGTGPSHYTELRELLLAG